MPGGKTKTLESLEKLIKNANESYMFLSDLVTYEDNLGQDEYDNSFKNETDRIINSIEINLQNYIEASKSQSNLHDFEKEVIEEEFNKIVIEDKKNNKDSFSFDSKDYECAFVDDKTNFSFEEFTNIPKNIESQFKTYVKGDFYAIQGTSENNDIPKEIELAKKPDVTLGENKFFDYKFFDTSKLRISKEKFRAKAIELGELSADKDYDSKNFDKKIRDYALILAFNEQVIASTDDLIKFVKNCRENADKYKKFADSKEYYDLDGDLNKKNTFKETIKDAENLIHAIPVENAGENIMNLQVRYKNNLFKRHDIEIELAQVTSEYKKEIEKHRADKNYVINEKIKEQYDSLNLDWKNSNTLLIGIKNHLAAACDKVAINDYKTKNAKKENLSNALLLQAQFEFYQEIKEENKHVLNQISDDEIVNDSGAQSRNYFTGENRALYRQVLNKDTNYTNGKLVDLENKLEPYKKLIDEFAVRNFNNFNIFEARKCELEEEIISREQNDIKASIDEIIDLDIQTKSEKYGLNDLRISNDESKDEDFDQKRGEVVFGVQAGLEKRQHKASAANIALEKKEEINKNYNHESSELHKFSVLDAKLSDRKARVSEKFRESIEKALPDVSTTNKEIVKAKRVISSAINRNNFFAKYDGVENGSNKLFNSLFKPYQKATENLWQLRDDIKNIKSEILDLNEISDIIDGTSKLPLNEATLQKIKNSLDYILPNKEHRDLISDYVSMHEDVRRAATNSANARAYFESSSKINEYGKTLGLCKLKFSPKLVNSHALTEKINEIEDLFVSNDFNLTNDFVKPFGKDKDITRLAKNIGLLQGVTNLLSSIPNESKYQNKDFLSYRDQIVRLRDLKKKLRNHLVDAYLNNKSKDLEKILNHIADEKTSKKPISNYLISNLFDKVTVQKNGERRRDNIASKLKANFLERDTKQQCLDLAKAYQIASTNVNNLKDFKVEVTEKLDGLKQSFDDVRKEYDAVAREIEKDNFFEEYSKKYAKYKSQNFFKRLFDSDGRKDLETTRDNLFKKYHLSPGALDIVKHGKKITGSELTSCMKDCIDEMPDLRLIEKAIYENSLFTDKKVMKSYLDFCKKGNFKPSKDITIAFETSKAEENNIKNEDKRIIEAQIARKKQEEIAKKVNIEKKQERPEVSQQVNQEPNQQVNQNINDDNELERTSSSIQINSKIDIDNDLASSEENLRTKSLVTLKKSIILESLNTKNNVGEQENVNQENSQQMINENFNNK